MRKGSYNYDQNYNKYEYVENLSDSLSKLNEDEDEGTLLQTVEQKKSIIIFLNNI